MKHKCDETLYLDYGNQMKLLLNPMSLSCEVTIRASSSYPHLMYYFDNFYMDCTYGYLEVLQGNGVILCVSFLF